jgi:hypothetical protein
VGRGADGVDAHHHHHHHHQITKLSHSINAIAMALMLWLNLVI